MRVIANSRALGVWCLTWVLAGVGVAGAGAQDAETEEPGIWTGAAEFSLVMTSGNAEADTVGLRAALGREWNKSALSFEVAGLRAESTITTRFGIGTPSDFGLVEESTTELTAENYHFRSRYDRSLNERLFVFIGADWERNTFAGIDSRYVASLGAGHHWFKTDDSHFATTYGVTFAQQDDVAGGSDSFAGVRLGYDYGRALTETTDYGSVLLVDSNVDETSDYRADFTNWVSVSMTNRLALKVSLQALYDNQPSLVAVPLFNELGEDTGLKGLAPLDDLDLLWTAAVVVKF